MQMKRGRDDGKAALAAAVEDSEPRKGTSVAIALEHRLNSRYHRQSQVPKFQP